LFQCRHYFPGDNSIFEIFKDLHMALVGEIDLEARHDDTDFSYALKI